MSKVLTADPRDSREAIFHVRLASTLQPGGSSGQAKVMIQKADDSWVETAMVIKVHDNDERGQNYGLAGEMFRVRRNIATRKFECIGSQGLVRQGVADGNIAKGSSGLVSIYNNPTGSSCPGTDSGQNVTACAVIAGVSSGDDVGVVYDPGLRNWQVKVSGAPTSGNEPVMAKCDSGQALLPGDMSGKWFSLYSYSSGSAAFTVNPSTEFLASSAHGLSNDDAVYLISDGTLPAGLSAGTKYYVINKTTDTFQVSLTVGGAAVDITDAGSGTHTWLGSGEKTDTGTNILVQDPCNNNCYLPGEFGVFLKMGDNYVPLGSHGLRRRAETDVTIAVGGQGQGQFYESGVLGTVTATFHNTYEGYNRPVETLFNDRFWAEYDIGQSKWIIEPPPMAMFAFGRVVVNPLDPSQAMTGFNQANLSDWLPPTGRTDFATANNIASTEASNPFVHAGSLNKDTLFMRELVAPEESPGTGFERSLWRVIDVEKELTDVVGDLRLHTNDYVQSDLLEKCYVESVVSASAWTDEILTEEC